ncbi:Trimethylguanosine synthase [Rhypophila decipiens]|uniref:Trimethylguanosine synthase n=1 Tax=Rhypophila decipiens TaxID=261697 RepID=A0AAN7BBY7_9PEZI|nr:Trimethylguanosine synthase [Rhypophila decipiens]
MAASLQVLHDKLPLTDKCHHYDDVDDVPPHIQKYWHQRYSIFDYYDQGVQLTDDAWFGVTPEPVANQIAQDLCTKTSKTTLIDLFGGAGGNVIAFASSFHFTRIIAIEKDAATLACAQHNAEVYGVTEYITFVLGDSLHYLSLLRHNPSALDPAIRVDPNQTTIFASPPWGGVAYREHEVFDLSTMEPYNLEKLYKACFPLETTLFLPRSSDLNQIAELLASNEEDTKLDVVQYCMEGASKAMVVYVPESKPLHQDDEGWSIAVEKDYSQ